MDKRKLINAGIILLIGIFLLASVLQERSCFENQICGGMESWLSFVHIISQNYFLLLLWVFISTFLVGWGGFLICDGIFGGI